MEYAKGQLNVLKYLGFEIFVICSAWQWFSLNDYAREDMQGYSKQENMHTIIRRDRWGDKCRVYTVWDDLRLITSESDNKLCD